MRQREHKRVLALQIRRHERALLAIAGAELHELKQARSRYADADFDTQTSHAGGRRDFSERRQIPILGAGRNFSA
jgi:hypothetical protein